MAYPHTTIWPTLDDLEQEAYWQRRQEQRVESERFAPLHPPLAAASQAAEVNRPASNAAAGVLPTTEQE